MSAPLPPDPRPDFVVLLARRLARALRSAARFGFESLASVGLRTALPPRREETDGSKETLAADRDDALRLPWSDALGFPEELATFGRQLTSLQVAPGDPVVEIGHGATGWRSHFLNLYGCPTVTIDGDAAALDTTRRLFRRHPATRWDLDPRFVVGDGRRIALPDGASGRILLPEGPPAEAPPAELLAELWRITADGGRVVVRLPGRRGTQGLESFAREATRAGFAGVSVVPVLDGGGEVPARRLRAFLRGRGLLAFWRTFSRAQLTAQIVVLSKGEFVPTTRRPGRLAGRIEVPPRRDGDEPLWLDAERGTTARLLCRLHNLGDTRWLAGERGAGDLGTTRIALRLGLARNPARALVPWHALVLPRDVPPGDVLEVEIDLPELPEPGDYRLGLVVEAEGVGEFGAECPGVELRLQVR